MMLDDVLGRESAIIAHASRVAEVRTAVAASGLDLAVFGIDVGPREGVMGDEADVLGGWLRKAGVDFALIRPDRVVYDAGKIHELKNVLAAFAAALPKPCPMERAA